jgi:Rps23 Pro-64 3,4-dihydroxylase Tpa1-like proline 4-hydroxylase
MLFSKEECDFIMNLSKELDQVNPYAYKDKINNEKKMINYSVWVINRNDKTQLIFDKIHTYFQNETNLKIKKELDKIYLHKYTKGQKFEKHTDTFYKTQIHNIGVCLNDNYEGGEFVLYNPEISLPKKQGSIYTFLSERVHEVKEILNGERWSIIGFLHIDNMDFPKKSLI